MAIAMSLHLSTCLLRFSKPLQQYYLGRDKFLQGVQDVDWALKDIYLSIEASSTFPPLVTVKNVLRHYQVSDREQNRSWPTTTGVAVISVPSIAEVHEAPL
jgi:hypothetical protein